MATRLGKRPHPKNYATYDPKGKAQYRKDLAEYLKKKAAMEKEKNKLSTKKNIEKQKTSNKKASTAKPKTTAKTKVAPKATATKAKSLATGKTTSKTKAVEPVKTPKTTTTKRRAATSTKKKVTPKAKATVKKPAVKPAGKVPAKKPLISNKNKLRIKKAATTARKATVKTAKTVGKKLGEAKKTIATKSTAVKKAFKKKAPKPTTPAQKAVSKVYQGGKKLIKKGVTKGLPKFIDAVKKNPKSALKGGIAGLATAGLTSAINTRMDRAFAKRAGMSLQEYQAKKKKVRDSQRIIPTATRTVKGIAKRLRGNSGESSTTKNINKQKKVNKTNNTGLKIKKTERSSKVNRNKDYNAKTATKKRNTGLSEFRVDPVKNRKLQLEAQNKKPITYSRELSSKAKQQVSDTKKNKDKKTTRSSFNEKFIRGKGGRLLRRGSPTAMRAEAKERARKRAQEAARKRRLRK